MRAGVRIAVFLFVALGVDWCPHLPPFPEFVHAASAQPQIPPPDAWHPYRGSLNCIQFYDGQGNFSCDPLVTVNSTTHTVSSIITSSSGGALVVGNATSFQALGTDLVIAKASTTVAPAGPGAGGVTLRVRPSPRIPGYCMIVAVAGGSFGVEYPLAFFDPTRPFVAPSIGVGLFDDYVTDLPGGPGGC